MGVRLYALDQAHLLNQTGQSSPCGQLQYGSVKGRRNRSIEGEGILPNWLPCCDEVIHEPRT